MSNPEVFNISLYKKLWFWIEVQKQPTVMYAHSHFHLVQIWKSKYWIWVSVTYLGEKNIKKKLQVLVYPM